MSNSEASATDKSAPVATIIAALVAGAAMLYALYIAQAGGRPVTIKVGDQVIELGANPELGQVLDTALAEKPGDFEALLSARGFFRVSSPNLIDALARIDEVKEGNELVTIGMRRLLWNLDGPFGGDGVLRDADVRFMKALEDIDGPIDASTESGALIIELWQRGLERRSPLGLRLFEARIVPVRADEGGGAPIYVCPGLNSGLGGKYVSIFGGETAKPIEGVLAEDTRRRMDCAGSPTRLRDLFAGTPVVLGVDPARFATLTGGEGARGEIAATIEIQPSRHVVAATAQPSQ